MLMFVNVVSRAPPSHLCQCFIVFMSNLVVVQILCTLNDFHLHQHLYPDVMIYFSYFTHLLYTIMHVVCREIYLVVDYSDL